MPAPGSCEAHRRLIVVDGASTKGLRRGRNVERSDELAH